MKTRMFSMVLAMLGMVASAEAGIISLVSHCCGPEKSCGCAPSCQPQCCKPVICRPSCPKVCTYQRSCCKSEGCGAAPGACAPKPCAAPAPAPAPACAPQAACAPAPAAAPACGAPAAQGCCQQKATCCEKTKCCNADPCEIAHWIYTSQTACYARDRRCAVDRLGDRFDCVCNPEIMCALIYALNDADETVRREAADEIGDQLKKNPCCCNDKVVAALTCALSDCDRSVARYAEKALRCCGYDVQDCSDKKCGASGQCGAGGQCGAVGHPVPAPAPAGHGDVAPPAPAPAPAPAAAPTSAPAPAPMPTEPEAYFPSRLKQQTNSAPRKSGLANLFGLVR